MNNDSYKGVIPQELSSICSMTFPKRNTIADLEFEIVDFDKLKFQDFYEQRDILYTQVIQIEGELLAKIMIKKIMNQVFYKIVENEQIKMIPFIGYDASINRIQQSLKQYLKWHEVPAYDILTGGLEEDLEPVQLQQEQWLVQKVNLIPAKIVEYEHQSTNSNRQSLRSLTAQTFMKSRVLIQDQAQSQKQLKEQYQQSTIDLNDPVDISMTEEILRAQKERQNKVKMELLEAERKRKLKEQQEEQLKYELMSKDKKSKQFTYDYDGKLISVCVVNPHKFPPTTAPLGSKFEDGQTKINYFRRKTNLLGSSTIKRKYEEEKEKDREYVKLQQLAPLVNENIKLQQGVAILQEGRVREGPKEGQIDLEKTLDPTLRMVRNQYLNLTQQINGSHHSSQQQIIKAEDLGTKSNKNDNDKKYIYNRIRRLSQQIISNDGTVKINSVKIYDEVAQIIQDDIQTVAPTSLNKQNKSQSQKNFASPTDQYNISLMKDQHWGKNGTNENANTKKLKGNKQKLAELFQPLSTANKKSRERRGISETNLSQKTKYNPFEMF